MKKKIILLEEPILRSTLILMCGGTFEEAVAELKGEIGVIEANLPSNQVQAFYFDVSPETNTKNFNCSFMWIPKYHWPTIVHETTHLVCHRFAQTGINIEWGNDEPFAYFMEFWTKKIAEAYRGAR